MKVKKTVLSATDYSGQPAKTTKTFEICLDHEPTPEELAALQNEAAQWQNMRILKLYPAQTKVEKQYSGKFWTVQFEVHESDWLFWCGFCAGKKWGFNNAGRGDKRKKRLQEIGEWSVQI